MRYYSCDSHVVGIHHAAADRAFAGCRRNGVSKTKSHMAYAAMIAGCEIAIASGGRSIRINIRSVSDLNIYSRDRNLRTPGIHGRRT